MCYTNINTKCGENSGKVRKKTYQVTHRSLFRDYTACPNILLNTDRQNKTAHGLSVSPLFEHNDSILLKHSKNASTNKSICPRAKREMADSSVKGSKMLYYIMYISICIFQDLKPVCRQHTA